MYFVVNYITWQNMVGVENDQLFFVGRRVGVASLGQRSSVNQLLAMEHFPGKNLTQQEFVRSFDISHAVVWELTEIHALPVPARICSMLKSFLTWWKRVVVWMKYKSYIQKYLNLQISTGNIDFSPFLYRPTHPPPPIASQTYFKNENLEQYNLTFKV